MRMIGLLIAFACSAVGAVEISVSDLSRVFGNALDIDRLLVGVVVQQKRSDIYAAKSDRTKSLLPAGKEPDFLLSIQ